MDPTAALHDLFGFPAFRPGQEEAVRGALAGRDALVVMPTGAGKSLCYQLPALCREDLTVVVSPLVSLMQDQVAALEARPSTRGRAAVVNAQQDAATNAGVLRRAAAGEVRLLYVAPERFSSPGFLEALKAVRVGLFVVDEAHCVSQWGHDFRPDYFRLADAARWLGAEAIIALTATATPEVAQDIEARLALRDPVKVTTGFDRPNLSFGVARCRTAADKRARLAAALADPAARPAIVYAGTRAATEELAGDLARELGTEVLAYHAGLARPARAQAQRRFMAGEVDVVVATNAFGMGVDKADVRTVVHAAVPQSVEAWYQEAGRAGRDGRPARAVLLAEARDKALHVFFIRRSEVEDAELDAAARRIAAAAEPPRLEGFADDEAAGPASAAAPAAPAPRFDLPLVALADDADRARQLVGHLVQAGVLQPAPAPMDRVRGRWHGPFDVRARARSVEAAQASQRARWRAYRTIWELVEGDECRRAAILRHFGDPAPAAPGVPCCDACDPGALPEGVSAPAMTARPRGGGPAMALDEAILRVVEQARPAVGRTRCVEVLRGSRSKALQRSGHDGLPGYGAFGHLHADDVLQKIDELLHAGRLRSTGGHYPTLRVVEPGDGAPSLWQAA